VLPELAARVGIEPTEPFQVLRFSGPTQ